MAFNGSSAMSSMAFACVSWTCYAYNLASKGFGKPVRAWISMRSFEDFSAWKAAAETPPAKQEKLGDTRVDGL